MTTPKQKIMMCAPDHFCVDYVINAWMDGQCGQVDKALAVRQWNRYKDIIEQFADVILIQPQPDLPDMVFTANAGLILGDSAVVSRFHNKERQGEEPYFKKWFIEQGLACSDWPQEVPFEGAGDALWDRGLPLLWIGSGYRSDLDAPPLLEAIYKREVIQMKLIDPRFYHLDTCMCPLTGGYMMYYPGAFAPESLDILRARVPADKRIAVSELDAVRFACNAVDLEGHVIMNDASTDLQDKLRLCGFMSLIVPLTEFLKAGGAAKCLTLKLVEEV